MAFTPFDAAMGSRQGRIRPAGFDPTSGEYAFVLGSDATRHLHDFEIGDHAETQQNVDLTGQNLVRAKIRMRNAPEIPAGVNWEASITIDGTRQTAMLLRPGRTRDRADMAANVSKLSGVHLVGLRLELVAV